MSNQPNILNFQKEAHLMDESFKTGNVKKIYEYGRRVRNPFATVTLYDNQTATVENCSTGMVYVANKNGISEAFGLAKRISESAKALDYAAGW